MAAALLKERTVAGLHENLALSLPNINSNSPILDLGCGTGAWLSRLANMGYTNLHGVDKDLNGFGCINAASYCADIDQDDLQLDVGRFDLITAIEMIEHLECPSRLLHHVRANLAPNGYFLLTSPNIHSALSRLRFLIKCRFFHFDEHGDHTHIYPIYLFSLERLLVRYGLQIVRKWTYPTKSAGIGSAPLAKLAGRLCSLFVHDELPGDILCLIIQRVSCPNDANGS